MTDGEQRVALDGADEVTLPVVDVLTGRGFLTGKSGSGKSDTASVVIEELLAGGFPVLVVDTDGEYWGLKETFEILHVGADEECDIQVGPEHAEKLAALALDENVPIILDVSGYLAESDASGLIRETARHLFAKEKKRKKPFLILVEEVHEYIPQTGGLDDTGEMLVTIGKRGRKHGLGLVGISQRPADVKKDFITQCDWLCWHRLTWDNDTSVVRRVLGSEYADTISDLADGEAFLMADWDDAIRRVQIRRKKTFDAGATPDLGAFERPELKSVSDDLVADLEAISERTRREEDRIAELEARVKDLHEEKDALEDELESARDMRDLAQQMAEGLQATDETSTVASETVDELVDERNALRSQMEERDARIKDLEQQIADLERYEARIEQLDAINPDDAEEALERLAAALGMDVDGNAEKWRRKYQQAHERVQALEAQETEVTAPDEYDGFVEDEDVRAAIEDATANSDASPRYVKGVVAGILQRGGSASRREIADDLGIETTHHIHTAMQALEERNVVTVSGAGDEETADFAFEHIDALHERQARQRRTEEVMDRL